MKKLSELRKVEAVNVIDGYSGRDAKLVDDLREWAKELLKNIRVVEGGRDDFEAVTVSDNEELYSIKDTLMWMFELSEEDLK